MNSLVQIGIVLTAIDKMSGVINGATDKATQGFSKLQHKIQQVSATLTEMGTKASVMGHGILSAMETPIKAFASLDEASTNLRVAMMDNLGQIPPQFEEINRQAIELGNVLPGTTADFVDSARALIENGTALETVVGGGLKAASYLGVILKLPQAGAAEMVAKFREAFGLAENELVKMADLTQRAKFAFGLGPEEIKYAAQYAGATLNNLKLTGIENTKMFLAMQGIARQKGMEGSVFGTNFSSMLNNIGQMEQKLGKNSKVMKEINADLRHAGISMQFFDSAGHFVGLEKMVGELEKLKVLTEQEKLNVMNKLFGSEGGRVASMLSEAGVSGLHRAMDTMARQADLMQRIEETNKSARNTWEALTGTIENFWAAVGGPVVTSLYPLIHAVNDFVGGPMMEWVKQNENLVKWLGLGALAVGGLLVVLGGLGIVVGVLGSGLAALCGVLAAVFSPVSLLIAAIATGAIWVLANWETVKDFFQGFWMGLKEGLAPIMPYLEKIGEKFTWLIDKAKEAGRWLWNRFAPQAPVYHDSRDGRQRSTVGKGIDRGRGFGASLTEMWRSIEGTVKGSDLFKKLGESFKSVEPYLEKGKALFSSVAEGLNKFWNVLKTFSGGFASGFVEEFKIVSQELKPYIDDVSAHVIPALQSLGNAVKAFLDYGLEIGTKVFDILKSILGGFEKGEKTTASFGKSAGKIFADITIGIAKLGASIVSDLVKLAADMVNIGAKIITSILEGMKSVSGTVLDWVGQFAGKIMDHFPRSPAKTGPFRDIPRIHIIESIAETLHPAPLVNAMRAAATAGMLALAPLTSPAMASLSSPAMVASAHASATPRPALAAAPAHGGGGGAVTVHFAPQITIHGTGTAKDDIMAALKERQHELVRLVEEAMARNARRQY